MLGGHLAADAVFAEADDLVVGAEFPHPFGELVYRQQQDAGDVAAGVLGGGSHVHEDHGIGAVRCGWRTSAGVTRA